MNHQQTENQRTAATEHRAISQAKRRYAKEGPPLPDDRIHEFASHLFPHEPGTVPYDAIFSTLRLTEPERWAVVFEIDSRYAIAQVPRIVDHRLVADICSHQGLHENVRTLLNRMGGLGPREGLNRHWEGFSWACSPMGRVERLIETILLEELTWVHLAAISMRGYPRIEAVKLYLAQSDLREMWALELGLTGWWGLAPSDACAAELDADRTVQECCEPEPRAEIEELIEHSREPWEHIDGYATHWGWFDAERRWHPPLPCSPCFGELGPYGAAWRNSETGHVRCSGCLEYSLRFLSPEKRWREARAWAEACGGGD